MLEPGNNDELPPIPGKRYFTIGEVSDLCAVKPHVLRYWEQEFPQLKPVKRRGNRRYYQRQDVIIIRQIRSLLYEEGFTIGGARLRLTGEEAVPGDCVAPGAAVVEVDVEGSVDDVGVGPDPGRYDDRGVGASGGEFAGATSADFADDALGAITFLTGRAEVGPIGVVGHSEGGLVGPMAAVRSSDIAFVVMLAGPGVTGAETMIQQSVPGV